MSQTTTAAASTGRPSFDFVLSCLPEDLSPSRRRAHCELLPGEDDEEPALPALPEYHEPADGESPRVNVSSLCRNTFVHLESASPLAKLSQSQLLESFKAFSNKLALKQPSPPTTTAFPLDWTGQQPSHYSPRCGPGTSSPDKNPSTDLQRTLSSDDHDQDHSMAFSESGRPQLPLLSSPYEARIATPTPTGLKLFFNQPATGGGGGRNPNEQHFTPRTKTRLDSKAGVEFDLLAWANSLEEQDLTSLSVPRQSRLDQPLATTRGSLYDLLLEPMQNLSNLFACAIAQTLLQPTQSENRKKELDVKTVEGEGEQLGHPTTCKPCAFFWSKGCLNGDSCQFCHLWHAPKRKKPMKEQKNLMIIAREDGKIAFLRCAIQDALGATDSALRDF